jgi:hypothetical protein
METKELLHELKHHIPLTLIAAILAVIIATLFYKTNINQTLFYVLHPTHIIFSAIATSAMFHKYKKNFLQAILIGATGAIIVGSLSDIIFPYLAALIFNFNIEFHLPLIETPILIIAIAIIGSIIGILTHYTKFPHTFHVFLSVFTSLFYLLAFTQIFTTINFIISILIISITVIIPCCISDIIFPFLFLNKKIKQCGCH